MESEVDLDEDVHIFILALKNLIFNYKQQFVKTFYGI